MSKETPTGEHLKELANSKAYKDLINFKPTKGMYAAKYKFWKSIKNNPLMSTSVQDISVDKMAEFCEAKEFYYWKENTPGFFTWFCQEDWSDTRLQSIIDMSMDIMEDIILGDSATSGATVKDKIMAYKLLCEMGDRFPNKKQQLVYVDKELGRMGPSEVTRQLEEAKRQLEGPKPEVDDGADIG
jgi:hypothetical protein